MNIYAGNLPYSMTEAELQDLFTQYGEVASVKIIMDRDTGRSKGFGFVTMPNQEEAEEAVKALDGSSIQGRNMRVNEARPRR
jgi:RNA recognition motif-containing protein